MRWTYIILLFTTAYCQHVGAQEVVSDSIQFSKERKMRVALMGGLVVGSPEVGPILGSWQNGKNLQIEFQVRAYKQWWVGINYSEVQNKYYVDDFQFVGQVMSDYDYHESNELVDSKFFNGEYMTFQLHSTKMYVSRVLRWKDWTLEPKVYFGAAEYFTEAGIHTIRVDPLSNYAAKFSIRNREDRIMSFVWSPSVSVDYRLFDSRENEIGVNLKVDLTHLDYSETVDVKKRDIHNIEDIQPLRITHVGDMYNVTVGAYIRF